MVGLYISNINDKFWQLPTTLYRTVALHSVIILLVFLNDKAKNIIMLLQQC